MDLIKVRCSGCKVLKRELCIYMRKVKYTHMYTQRPYIPFDQQLSAVQIIIERSFIHCTVDYRNIVITIMYSAVSKIIRTYFCFF